MRIPNNSLRSASFTARRGQLEQKDKILLSTPALAALSAAYKNRRGMPSKMIMEGAKSGLKWGAFLLSLCSMMGLNKFLARNSQKFRDFEHNHGIAAMAGVGVASAGGYYLLKSAGETVAEKHPRISSGIVNGIKSVDNNNFIMEMKSTMRDGRLSYRRMIAAQPEYVIKSARFVSRMTRTAMASLPYVGAGLACAIAILKPKMLPDKY